MKKDSIRGSYAHVLYSAAKDWLAVHGPTSDIMFRSSSLAGNGNMDDIGPNGTPRIFVGTGGIVNSDIAFFRPGVAMLPLVALFHEAAGHAVQVTHEFQGRSRLQKALFYSHYACKGSRRYYGIDDDDNPHRAYFGHPHEIAAQYAGLKCAKTWLSYAVGETTAEAWLLDYVALRKERRSACPGEDPSYGSIDGILSAMATGFQRSLDEPRLFDPDPADLDSLSLFAGRREGKGILDIVRNCRNGMRTDGMMAVAWLEWTGSAPGSEDIRAFVLSTPIGKDLETHGGRMFVGTGSPVFPPARVLSPNMKKLFLLAGRMTADNVPEIRDAGLGRKNHGAGSVSETRDTGPDGPDI